MNYKEKQKNYRKLMGFIQNNYSEGCIKITNGEGHLHARVKVEVAHWLKKNDYKVYSEANFRGSLGRPDLIAINEQGYGYIVEIVNSESEMSLNLKLKKYPSEFELIIVKVKDFNYDTFKL